MAIALPNLLSENTHTPTSSIQQSKTGKSAKNSFKIEIKYKTWSNTAEQLTINCFSIFPKISFRQNCLEFMDITYHKFELCFICWQKRIQIIKLYNLLVFRLAGHILKKYYSISKITYLYSKYSSLKLSLLLDQFAEVSSFRKIQGKIQTMKKLFCH